MLATSSGSDACTVTVARRLAAGTAGVWERFLKAGPAFATCCEFGAPGVPPSSGASKMEVRGNRLK